MTDNFEDIEHQETVHAEETPTGARSNLAEAWRTRPIFKLLVVMTVAGAAIAAGTTFFSGSKQEQLSRMVNPPDVHQAPGGAASPYFAEQTKLAEEQRSKEALKNGTSALPTPMGQPGDINVTEKTDPMNELRSETEHLKQQILQMQQVQTQHQAQQAAAQQAAQQAAASAPHQQAEQFDPALSQAMQNQMKQLMDSWSPKAGIKQVSVSKEDAAGSSAGQVAGNQSIGGGAGVQTATATASPKPLIPAGTINYAQLLTEANSDIPAPILAEIVSGPLSGARAIGSFEVASGYSDFLVLKFKTANLKGKDYTINAIALDPDTTLAGMATEVDQRYFERVVLPAAAAFIQGFGSTLSQNPTTVSQSSSSTIATQAAPSLTQGLYAGMGSSAQTISSFFQDQANKTKPLIRVATGTPMGFFFTSSVYDPSAMPPPSASNSSANGCPQGTSPGFAVGGRVLNVPGVPPNGCYPPTAVSGSGTGLPALPGYPGSGYPGSGGNSVPDVPYPNYANQQPSQNRSPFSPYPGIGGYGYGH